MVDKIFILLIKIYKVVFSFKRPSCRYIPSCSTYAIEAITKYGALKGGFFALQRILRCRPGIKTYSNFGYDPVK